MSDVHRKTAAEMFGVPEDQVTPEQRSAARAANFGVLYGPVNPFAHEGTIDEEAHVRIARLLGVDSSTCLVCGVTTHRRQGDDFVKVAEHAATCRRGPNLQNIPIRNGTEEGTRIREFFRRKK